MLIITSFSYLKLISKQSINEPEITGKSLVFVCLALQRTIVMKNAMHTIIKKTVVMEILHDYLLKLIKFTLHNFLWSFFRCFFSSISCSQVCLMYDMQKLIKTLICIDFTKCRSFKRYRFSFLKDFNQYIFSQVSFFKIQSKWVFFNLVQGRRKNNVIHVHEIIFKLVKIK